MQLLQSSRTQSLFAKLKNSDLTCSMPPAGELLFEPKHSSKHQRPKGAEESKQEINTEIKHEINIKKSIWEINIMTNKNQYEQRHKINIRNIDLINMENQYQYQYRNLGSILIGINIRCSGMTVTVDAGCRDAKTLVVSARLKNFHVATRKVTTRTVDTGCRGHGTGSFGTITIRK